MGQRDTILIVDDMEVNRVILSGLFQEEYHLLEAENGEQALLLLKQYHGNIAIMLLDVVMPVMDGYQVMKEMGGSGLLDEVPVVVITADNSLEGELRSFDLGASDIIVKPFEPHVVKRRVHNIIELYLHKHNLEDMVDQQAHKLKESNDVLVDALSSVIEYRSLESGQHIKRIRLLTRVLLQELAQNCPEYGLDQHKIEVIASASALHDIGKIGIPENILNKTGKLTAEEYEIMKRHVEASVEIIRHLPSMDYVIPAVIGHHERYDGKGYPRRIAGKDIPLAARILCIADSFDAMVSKRSYKSSMSVEFAINELEKGAGTQFDPEMVPLFVELVASGAVMPVLDEGGVNEDSVIEDIGKADP